MWSNGLDDVPEVFSHPNESVICHLCLLQCVVLCVCVCAWFLMFPCVPGAWMSSDPYCQSSKSFLSLSCQFTPFWSISLTFPCLLPNCWSFVSVCPLASFCLHFIYTGVCFHACAPVPENVHTCPFSLLLHFFLLPVLQWELWEEKGRQKENFPFCNRTTGNCPVWVERGLCFWKYPGPTGIWCLTRGVALTLLCGSHLIV